ncbi:MAG: hypothetical protein V4535_10605 [Bacteroidota bacterium]
MKLKKNVTYLFLLLAAIVGLIIHKTALHFLIPQEFEDNFIYSIPLLYGIFAGLSLVIIYLLSKVKATMPDSVGYAFLALTTVKLVIAYVLLRSITKAELPKTAAEKACFFVVFIYFLAIETYLTIRILNNKQ